MSEIGWCRSLWRVRQSPPGGHCAKLVGLQGIDAHQTRGTALQRETVVNRWLTILPIRLERPRVALVWPSLRPGD